MGWEHLSTIRTISSNFGQGCLLVAGMADDPDELVERLTAYYGLPTNPMDCGGSAINALERDIAVGEMILRAATDRATLDDGVCVWDSGYFDQDIYLRERFVTDYTYAIDTCWCDVPHADFDGFWEKVCPEAWSFWEEVFTRE